MLPCLSELRRSHRHYRKLHQVACCAVPEAFPRYGRGQSSADGIVFGLPHIVRAESCGRTKTMWRETTFVKQFHGISKRRYSVSSMARKRSFLFDEPPVRNDKQPDFTTNREGTPTVEGIVVEGKDPSIDRNSLQDPYGKHIPLPTLSLS